MLGAMVSAMDEAMGNITDALKATNQWDSTLIVWVSDNGGHGARVLGRILHSMMPLSFTPLLRVKRCHACDQWHSSRVSTLTG
jgi:arylsulfatase A-like enzyme